MVHKHCGNFEIIKKELNMKKYKVKYQPVLTKGIFLTGILLERLINHPPNVAGINGKLYFKESTIIDELKLKTAYPKYYY